MLQVPYFETIDARMGWDALALAIMVGRLQGKSVVAIKVVMVVIMTFRSDPTGASHSRSTGK